jgi:hypothetical protein
MPVPLLPSLAPGLAVGGHRTTSLILITATLGIGTYLRRFAARGFIGGIFLFLGFFLHPLVPIGSVGWLYAEIGVGMLTAMAVRFVFFRPRPLRGLRRTQRSYLARARHVAQTVLNVLDNGSDRRCWWRKCASRSAMPGGPYTDPRATGQGRSGP